MTGAIQQLRKWRLDRGFTMEQAAAHIVVDGRPVDKATWHAWESGRKIPRPPWMLELERVTGVEPNAFYPRPDAGGIIGPPALPALL